MQARCIGGRGDSRQRNERQKEGGAMHGTEQQVLERIEEERAVAARELARQLDCAVSSVYRMNLPHIVIGGRSGGIRFYPSVVKRELERRAQERRAAMEQENLKGNGE